MVDLKGDVAAPWPPLRGPSGGRSHQSEMLNSEGTGLLLALPSPEALPAPGTKEALFFPFFLKLNFSMQRDCLGRQRKCRCPGLALGQSEFVGLG